MRFRTPPCNRTWPPGPLGPGCTPSAMPESSSSMPRRRQWFRVTCVSDATPAICRQPVTSASSIRRPVFESRRRPANSAASVATFTAPCEAGGKRAVVGTAHDRRRRCCAASASESVCGARYPLHRHPAAFVSWLAEGLRSSRPSSWHGGLDDAQARPRAPATARSASSGSWTTRGNGGPRSV